MSNNITAYFKGRMGVTEALYQNDYGIIMNFDGISLPAHFDCYFSIDGEDEAVPAVGSDDMVQIPNACLAHAGKIELHIPLHSGENDSEVEYVVYTKVIGRARPVDDGTPVQMTAIEQALALLQNPIGNIEQIVNEALSFTGETFAEMQEQLDADQAAFQSDMGDRADAFEAQIQSDISDVESDFDNLNAQYQTAVAAHTVDSEVQNVRVGADNVTYASAGEAVRTQVTNLKNDYLNNPYAVPNLTIEAVDGYWYSYAPDSGTAVSATPHSTTTGMKCIQIPVTKGDEYIIALGLVHTGNNRLWAVIDANRYVLSRSTNSGSETDTRSTPVDLTITDDNAAYLLINFNPTSYPNGYIVNAKANAITRISNEIDSKISAAFSTESDLTANVTLSGTIYTGAVGTKLDTEVHSDSVFRHIIMPCNAGDRFILSGRGGSSAALWALTDSDYIILSKETTTTDKVNLEVPVTSDGYAVFNFNVGSGRTFELMLIRSVTIDDLIEMSSEGSYDVNNVKINELAWSNYQPIEDMTGWNSTWNNANFATYYNLFHSIYEAHSTVPGFEEINMSTAYLADPDVSDSIPTEISNIGNLLMYHIPPLPYSFDMTDNDEPIKPLKVLIVSGIHGSEKKSIIDCSILLRKLLENSTDSAIVALRACDVYIAPMIDVWGIENNNRFNYNSINLNRDFPLRNWRSSSGSSSAPLSQYETRCLVWWINQISPDVLIDHHTSSGNLATETKAAIHWGESTYDSLVSLINDNEKQLTPYYLSKYYDKLSAYQFVYGYALVDGVPYSGKLVSYGCEKGIPSITYEVMQHLKWDVDGDYIFGFDDDGENALVTIAYHGFINMLCKLSHHVAVLKNNGTVFEVDY